MVSVVCIGRQSYRTIKTTRYYYSEIQSNKIFCFWKWIIFQFEIEWAKCFQSGDYQLQISLSFWRLCSEFGDSGIWGCHQAISDLSNSPASHNFLNTLVKVSMPTRFYLTDEAFVLETNLRLNNQLGLTNLFVDFQGSSFYQPFSELSSSSFLIIAKAMKGVQILN